MSPTKEGHIISIKRRVSKEARAQIVCFDHNQWLYVSPSSNYTGDFENWTEIRYF